MLRDTRKISSDFQRERDTMTNTLSVIIILANIELQFRTPAMMEGITFVFKDCLRTKNLLSRLLFAV